MRYLYDRYAIREIMIMDDCFNVQKDRAIEILDRIAASDMDICLRFPNGMRADILDRDILLALKDARTFAMCVAIETASERLQKLIKKNLDLESSSTTFFDCFRPHS